MRFLRYSCPRCGGNLYKEHGRISCLQCGREPIREKIESPGGERLEVLAIDKETLIRSSVTIHDPILLPDGGETNWTFKATDYAVFRGLLEHFGLKPWVGGDRPKRYHLPVGVDHLGMSVCRFYPIWASYRGAMNDGVYLNHFDHLYAEGLKRAFIAESFPKQSAREIDLPLYSGVADDELLCIVDRQPVISSVVRSVITFADVQNVFPEIYG